MDGWFIKILLGQNEQQRTATDGILQKWAHRMAYRSDKEGIKYVCSVAKVKVLSVVIHCKAIRYYM